MKGKYKSAFGYENGDDGIDSFGVNHKNFNLRDELYYQYERNKKEQELMKDFGEAKDYPDLGKSFWGTNPDNNYGFGFSDISKNIDEREKILNNQKRSEIKGELFNTPNNQFSFKDIYYSKYDDNGNRIYKGISDEEGGGFKQICR